MSFAMLCVVSSPAQALMMVSFEGVVTDSFVFTDSFGFGTGNSVLTGRTLTGSFFYDPDLAPSASDIVFHQTTSDYAAWF